MGACSKVSVMAIKFKITGQTTTNENAQLRLDNREVRKSGKYNFWSSIVLSSSHLLNNAWICSSIWATNEPTTALMFLRSKTGWRDRSFPSSSGSCTARWGTAGRGRRRPVSRSLCNDNRCFKVNRTRGKLSKQPVVNTAILFRATLLHHPPLSAFGYPVLSKLLTSN